MNCVQLGTYYTVIPTAPSNAQSAALTITNDYSLRVAITAGTVTISGITAIALSDDMANPTALPTGAFMLAYDGATWDRVRSFSAASATLALGAGAPSVISAAFYFDSQAGTFRRVRCDNNGQQLVTNGKPVLGTQDQITRAYSPDVTGASIKASQAQVFSVVGSNGTATGAFLCLVNKASAAVNGDAIYEAKWCPALSNAQMDHREWGLQGENLSTGFAVCWSTTATNVTLPHAGTGFAILSHYI